MVEISERPQFLGTVLWSAALGLVLYHVVKKFLLFRKMPPGPWGLPVIGKMLYFSKPEAFEHLRKCKEKYGNIFSFSSGDHYVIVINGHKTIQEIAKKEDFCARPDFYVWEQRNYGNRNTGILVSDVGPVWQEQRRFTIRSLRDSGLGKQSMEGMIADEMEQLVKHLRKDVGKPMNLRNSFNASVLNSLWTLIAGKRFELDDPKFLDTVDVFTSSLSTLTITGPGLFFPWPGLYGLTPYARKVWNLAMEARQKLRSLISDDIDQHVKTHDDNQTRDFIDGYLHEIKKSPKGSSFHGEEGNLNLRVVLLDLFLAGVETTATTLLWASLFLAKNPAVQKKLQAEVDSVLGDKPAGKDDKQKLVYLDAFLNEVFRMSSLVPVSVYHKMSKDVEFRGHFLPKGSVVFLNLHDAHHDPHVWEEPDVFRPERFLDPSGTKVIKHEALMPFGTGQRLCLGEAMARDSLLIFLSGLIQNFNFLPGPGTKEMDKQFTVILTDRKAK